MMPSRFLLRWSSTGSTSSGSPSAASSRQEMALIRPALVRKLVLASSAPQAPTDARLGARRDQSRGRAGAQPRTDTCAVFFTSSEVEPTRCATGPRTDVHQDRANPTSRPPGQQDGLSTTPSAPGASRIARCCNDSARDRPAGLRGQWRQRPHDPSSLLLPARRVDSASTGVKICRNSGARVPVPASRRVCCRRRRVPRLTGR